MFVHIRICAAFCCSEEKREEAEGGNSNGKLYKDWVVRGLGNVGNNAGSGSIDLSGVVDNWASEEGLVDALLGSVDEGGILLSDNVSTAVDGARSGAEIVISSATETSDILVSSDVGGLCHWNSNNKCEGDEDGGGFHIEILFAVN